MHVRVDESGLQVQQERARAGRLIGPGGLFEVLASTGCEVTVGSVDSLDDVQVVILNTRIDLPYEDSELTSLHEHVRNGGGLICLSNHGPFAFDKPFFNATRFDQSVASLFCAAFRPEAIGFTVTRALIEMPVRGPLAAPGWPALPGRSDSRVKTVVSNNACGIHPDRDFQPIASFPEGVSRWPDHRPTDTSLLWGVTKECAAGGFGRVVLVGDSGWIGLPRDGKARTGQMHLADNAQLISNMVHWSAAGSDLRS